MFLHTIESPSASITRIFWCSLALMIIFWTKKSTRNGSLPNPGPTISPWIAGSHLAISFAIFSLLLSHKSLSLNSGFSLEALRIGWTMISGV